MYNEEMKFMVKISELRADIPETAEWDSVLKNAPEFEDGYIPTSKVAGV